MKKMNLSFSVLKTKMVLPLFLLIGLFMLSATTVSAQYVSQDEAKVILDDHLTQLPKEIHTFAKVNQALTPQMVDQKINELRHMFGKSVLIKLPKKGVEESIKTTYDKAKLRIPSDMPELVQHLDAIRDEYVDLLTK